MNETHFFNFSSFFCHSFVDSKIDRCEAKWEGVIGGALPYSYRFCSRSFGI